MKIVKINQKPQDSLYTPVRNIIDDFFTLPSVFDSLVNRSIMPSYNTLMADVWEEGDNYFVKMAMPGVKKEDIKISVTGDTLSIEGESKEEKEEKEKKYFLKTFQSCSYSQSFNLPSLVNPDGVEAKFEDGVLTITLPKAKESESKQISIK